ncbi:MAG: hypothetical protein IIV15_03010 [Ruminococcus sp.]|nr:hypothetical protein [Ruminococcus sp.]
MARKKTTTTVEETEVTPEEQTPGQVELGGGQLSIAEKLAQIIDPENDELFCRIYKQSGNRNAPTREFIERVDGVLVDEEYIAENYGGGCYFVRYVFKENGVTRNTSGVFTISETYRAKTGAPAPEQQPKNMLAGLLENLTAEKVGGIVAAVEAVRKIFAPPVDLTKLMEAALSNRQQSVSDAVLLEAMKGIKQPQQPRNLLEEVRQLQEVKALIKDEPATVEDDDEEDNDKGGPMNIIVKTALEMLPAFLQQNNNNYEATGAQFRNNPVVNNLLAKDPSLREKFIDAARHEYGDQKTQELVRGFGLDVQFIEPAEAAAQPAALETVKG